MPGQWHRQPTPEFAGSRMYACLGVTCHLHFWQNDGGLLCATSMCHFGKGPMAAGENVLAKF